MEVSIKQASPDDLGPILLLKPGIDEETVLQRIGQTQSQRAVYWVAVYDGAIVGHVFLKFYGKETAPGYPDIEDLYVHASFRRRGIANALLRQCERAARDHEFKSIGLAVGIEDHPAQILYRGQGYYETGCEPYVDGIYNGVEDWVIDMKKDLDAE